MHDKPDTHTAKTAAVCIGSVCAQYLGDHQAMPWEEGHPALVTTTGVRGAPAAAASGPRTAFGWSKLSTDKGTVYIICSAGQQNASYRQTEDMTCESMLGKRVQCGELPLRHGLQS